MHHTFTSYIYLLLIIIFLVMVAQRLKISYPIVLVLGGLALSFVPGLTSLHIDPELIFLIFLPPLLYEAAQQTSWKEFWKWRRVIASFAFLIVIVTSCLIAFVSSNIIPGFTLALGFLLGGIISPPDAISATSVMKGVKVPKRVLSIVEGESLLNDASSLIVFRFALGAIQTGKFVMADAVLSFFIVIIMGIVTGLVIALVIYTIHRWLPTTSSIDIVLTIVSPYIMYIVAEKFHYSGVLAVVSGGLYLSSRRLSMLSHLSRIQSGSVWTTLGFVLNGLVFMLIGLQLPIIIEQLGNTGLKDAIKYSLIISFVLIISRIACTLGASKFTVFISRYITTADSKPGWKMPLVFGWAGMRGVVSLAAALSIPVYLDEGVLFPQRNMILFITFIVILITLVFQGLTLPILIKWLKLEDPDYTTPFEEQDILIRKKLAKESLKLLEEKYDSDLRRNEHLINLKLKLEADVRDLEKMRHSDGPDTIIKTSVNFQKIYKELIQAQRALLHTINKKQEVDEDVVRKHLLLLDLEEERLRQRSTFE